MFTAYPFQKDETHEYKCSTADGKVVASHLKLTAKSQVRFAGFKTAFDWLAVSITTHDFAIRLPASAFHAGYFLRLYIKNQQRILIGML